MICKKRTGGLRPEEWNVAGMAKAQVIALRSFLLIWDPEQDSQGPGCEHLPGTSPQTE